METLIALRILRATDMLMVSCLLLAWASVLASGAQEDATLDLTKAPPSARRSMGVPGGFAGGLSDGSPQGVLANPFDLPVKLSIGSLRKEATPGGALLKLNITNTSKADFAIPACLDA